jgi:hypothetical protein
MLGKRRAKSVFPKLEYKDLEVSCDGRSVQLQKILEIHEPRAERRSRWAARAQPKAPLCACGCGQPVLLKARHRTEGPPRYVHGHHPNPIRRAYEKLRRAGYRLIADACRELAVSPTTLRRLEADGTLPRAKRIELLPGRTVRVFRDPDVKLVQIKLAERGK